MCRSLSAAWSESCPSYPQAIYRSGYPDSCPTGTMEVLTYSSVPSLVDDLRQLRCRGFAFSVVGAASS